MIALENLFTPCTNRILITVCKFYSLMFLILINLYFVINHEHRTNSEFYINVKFSINVNIKLY